ncbi:hypothetical protein AAK899_11420 [Erysipelotrichaceae bacterium 51-3]|uniref:hypothetical protein n=1 Tax=Allobaculum sp. JKK-2023 TaxID=3108943 RepID=UPI002B0622D0|nr:hypothetical protein [Allobaculum sp. JKK-2023]
MIVTFQVLTTGLIYQIQIEKPARMTLHRLAVLCHTEWHLNCPPIFYSMAVGHFLDEHTPLNLLDLVEGDRLIVVAARYALLTD